VHEDRGPFEWRGGGECKRENTGETHRFLWLVCYSVLSPANRNFLVLVTGAMMRKLVCSIAAASVLATSIPLAAQPVATFKSAISLVPISAVVRDGRGRLVTTLTAADFEVWDNGESRRIIEFQNDAAGAVTLAVLVDMSGSMEMGRKMDLARDVLARLSAGLQNGRDEASLFTFDAALYEAQPFTVMPASFDATLTGAPFGSTSLYDGIAETAKRLQSRPGRRRAIVVVTDGIDTSSALTAPEVSALASSIDVPVYVIATVASIDRPDDDAASAGEPSADIYDLARWTGGDFMWVSDAADAAAGTARIFADLRHQYLIAIESSAHEGWRPLDVRVRGKRLNVRTRGGYFSVAR
jgi:VWFA-related protein